MKKNRIVFYPVGNGDTTLLQLENGQNLLVDCYITSKSENDNDDSRYDIKTDLHSRLPKRNNSTLLDVFIQTHPHNDHIQGFESTFFTGDPKNYDFESGLILLDEIWFAPRILFEETLDEHATEFKKEVTRRFNLHKKNAPEKNDAGNRIKLIGYSDQEDLSKVEDLIYVPGQIIDSINQIYIDNLELKVLGPTKMETDEEEDTNDTSIMMQICFLQQNSEITYAFGGDAGSDNWKRVFDSNPELSFDILLAPHHCSYKFFNEHRMKDDPYTPEDDIVTFLNSAQAGNYIIASSKAIHDDNNSPPSYPAKKEYLKAIKNTNGHFQCLGDYPNEKEPKPFILEITPQGPCVDDDHLDTKKTGSSDEQVRTATTHRRTYGSRS